MTVFTGKPIDFERIEDATGGDEEFLKELVEIFLDDADLRIQELKSALAQNDATELSRTAHKLKGASANMGADGLSTYARVLEEIVAGKSADDAKSIMQGLEHELGRVKQTLSGLIN